MKTMVKWSDLKRFGVTRWRWRHAKGRMRPVPGTPKIYRATDVARVLDIPLEVFARMK